MALAAVAPRRNQLSQPVTLPFLSSASTAASTFGAHWTVGSCAVPFVASVWVFLFLFHTAKMCLTVAAMEWRPASARPVSTLSPLHDPALVSIVVGLAPSTFFTPSFSWLGCLGRVFVSPIARSRFSSVRLSWSISPVFLTLTSQETRKGEQESLSAVCVSAQIGPNQREETSRRNRALSRLARHTPRHTTPLCTPLRAVPVPVHQGT
jgi:hypothetical protein